MIYKAAGKHVEKEKENMSTLVPCLVVLVSHAGTQSQVATSNYLHKRWHMHGFVRLYLYPRLPVVAVWTIWCPNHATPRPRRIWIRPLHAWLRGKHSRLRPRGVHVTGCNTAERRRHGSMWQLVAPRCRCSSWRRLRGLTGFLVAVQPHPTQLARRLLSTAYSLGWAWIAWNGMEWMTHPACAGSG